MIKKEDAVALIKALENGFFYTAAGEASALHEEAAEMIRALLEEIDRLRTTSDVFAKELRDRKAAKDAWLVAEYDKSPSAVER